MQKAPGFDVRLASKEREPMRRPVAGGFAIVAQRMYEATGYK
jgi:hypothetical protein